MMKLKNFSRMACTAVALLAGVVSMTAQSTMVVNKTDGTQVKISIADIDNVVFPDDNALEVEVENQSYCLLKGQWMQFNALFYQNGDETYVPNVEWSSTDTSVATIDDEGKVTAVAEGECQIVVKGGGAEGRMKLKVFGENQFDIEVKDIERRSCNFTITPKDETVRYYCNLRIMHGDSYSVDSMTPVGSEEQNMYEFSKDWWKYVASMYEDMTWTEYMNEYNQLVSGKYSESSYETHDTGLEPGSEYAIWAFGVNEDGTLSTPVEVKKFTTLDVQMVDMTFECSMDAIGSSDATFTITPSNNDAPYFVNVQRASYVDYFINNNKMGDMATSLAGSFSPSVYPEAYCKGKVTRSMTDFLGTVRSDNDYYVIVFGWDEGATTPVQVFKFHTK